MSHINKKSRWKRAYFLLVNLTYDNNPASFREVMIIMAMIIVACNICALFYSFETKKSTKGAAHPALMDRGTVLDGQHGE
jgi:hypothetical protein